MGSLLIIELSTESQRRLKRQKKHIRIYPYQQKGLFYISSFSYRNLLKLKIPHQIFKKIPFEKIPIQIKHTNYAQFFSPPHPDALEEAILYVISQQKTPKFMILNYQGRIQQHSSLLPSGTFVLDRPGGSRNYQWSIEKKKKISKKLSEQFPKLRALMQQPQTKVVVSFGSGGVRLFAHPTLMKFLNFFDLRKHIDEVWGCSGGALTGLPYALGVDPELIEEEGYHLYNDRYSIRWSPNKLEVLQNLIKHTFSPISEEMLAGFRDCQDTLLTVFGKYMRKRKTLTKHIIPFYCVAYNLNAQQLEVLTEEKIPRYSYATPFVKARGIDAVIASSSIPILYHPKRIVSGGIDHCYVDGATIEEVPLITPYQKWNRDKRQGREQRKQLLIICSNLFPSISKNTIFNKWYFKKLPIVKYFQLFVKYWDLIRHARIQEHKKTLGQNPHVKLIELNLTLDDSAVLDAKVIPQVIQKAQNSYYKQLLHIEKSL